VRGAFLGAIVLVTLPTFMESDLAGLVGIAVFVFLMLVGYTIGKAADTRDEIEDLVKKR